MAHREGAAHMSDLDRTVQRLAGRIMVDVAPHAAPEPVRPGQTPTRAAQYDVAMTLRANELGWATHHNLGTRAQLSARANAYARGVQEAWRAPHAPRRRYFPDNYSAQVPAPPDEFYFDRNE